MKDSELLKMVGGLAREQRSLVLSSYTIGELEQEVEGREQNNYHARLEASKNYKKGGVDNV